MNFPLENSSLRFFFSRKKQVSERLYKMSGRQLWTWTKAYLSLFFNQQLTNVSGGYESNEPSFTTASHTLNTSINQMIDRPDEQAFDPATVFAKLNEFIETTQSPFLELFGCIAMEFTNPMTVAGEPAPLYPFNFKLQRSSSLEFYRTSLSKYIQALIFERPTPPMPTTLQSPTLTISPPSAVLQGHYKDAVHLENILESIKRNKPPTALSVPLEQPGACTFWNELEFARTGQQQDQKLMLGAGSYGLVLQAHSPRNANRKFAVKLLLGRDLPATYRAAAELLVHDYIQSYDIQSQPHGYLFTNGVVPLYDWTVCKFDLFQKILLGAPADLVQSLLNKLRADNRYDREMPMFQNPETPKVVAIMDVLDCTIQDLFNGDLPEALIYQLPLIQTETTADRARLFDIVLPDTGQLTEREQKTLRSYLYRWDRLGPLLIQLLSTLHKLQRDVGFAHGDLHTQNVYDLYDSSRTLSNFYFRKIRS